MKNKSDLVAALGEIDSLKRTLEKKDFDHLMEVSRVKDERSNLRLAVKDFEKRNRSLIEEKEKVSRDLYELQMKYAERSCRLEKASWEVDQLQNKFDLSELEVARLKDEVGTVKEQMAKLEAGEAIPDTVREKVLEDVLASKEWSDLQKQLVVQSAKKIRDEVQKQYPELDLGFLAPRLGEAPPDDDEDEEEQGDADHPEVEAGEGGTEAIQSADAELVPPEAADSQEAPRGDAPAEEIVPQVASSEVILLGHRSE